MKDEKCFNCGELTSPYFLREILIGFWPFKKKVKVCLGPRCIHLIK